MFAVIKVMQEDYDCVEGLESIASFHTVVEVKEPLKV